MITEQDVEMMFTMGFDCSQIVLSEVSEKVGMSKEEALRVASCFGIGMAQGGVCGAATGAMMAIGLKYGNTEPGDLSKKDSLFKIRDEFIRRFEQMNGKVQCPDLLGKRVDSLQEMILNKPEGVFKDCPRYCVNAVMILNEIL